jgi:hypothetical protein
VIQRKRTTKVVPRVLAAVSPVPVVVLAPCVAAARQTMIKAAVPALAAVSRVSGLGTGKTTTKTVVPASVAAVLALWDAVILRRTTTKAVPRVLAAVSLVPIVALAPCVAAARKTTIEAVLLVLVAVSLVPIVLQAPCVAAARKTTMVAGAVVTPGSPPASVAGAKGMMLKTRGVAVSVLPRVLAAGARKMTPTTKGAVSSAGVAKKMIGATSTEKRQPPALAPVHWAAFGRVLVVGEKTTSRRLQGTVALHD